MRKTVSGILLALLFAHTLILALSFQPVKSGLGTWTVDDDGPADFHTVQEAINAASPGGTIFVKQGIYFEHIIVNNSVSLIGEDKATAIIDGNETETVVNITASNVGFTGFTVRASGSLHPCSGVLLEQSFNCTIGDNILTNNLDVICLISSNNNTITRNEIINNRHFGICLYESHNNMISGNLLTNNLAGVYSYISDGNKITHNIVATNDESGLFLVNSTNNIVTENKITSSKYYGVLLIESSSYNNISMNNITASNYDGIGIAHSDNNVIVDNNLASNEYGIRLSDSLNNSITGNRISKNYAGLFLVGSSNNTLRNNSMTNNTRNFGVLGELRSHCMNDIDASNMVDGKPICYWINKKDMVVPADAGFVALVCCTNITARNLNLKNNFQGIFLVYTNYSTVTGSDLINNIFGIRIAASSCNSVTENTVNNTSLVDDSMGIYLDECDNCSISENLACNNFYGVLVNNSKGCTIRENNAHNNVDGFYLNYSRQCVISGNNARDNRAYGIWLTNCSMSTLNENILDSNEHVGIYLETCTYCLLSGNKAKNDNICFEIRYCGNITLRRNDAINSDFGIHFLDSRYCTLRDNTMTGNKYNFGVDDSFILEMLIHDIDVSNKVDDRPIYYLVNEHDKQVPNDAGYVAAVNSTGIRVENVCLMHNVQGALLAFTNYSIVRDTIAFKNSFGIQLRRCHNCTTSESNASKNDYDGIILDNSHYCIINQNDINYNGQFGVHIWDSTHNVFFHSNFINNAWQALITRSSNNSWDNGYPSGGNYWGAYSDTDVYWGLNQDRLGSDGLGDMPYRIYEYATDCDRYPLIVPWTDIPSIGDLNHDGIVNIVDISIVAKAFGAKLGDPNWTDTLDLDKNGMINSLDISMIAICHGKTV